MTDQTTEPRLWTKTGFAADRWMRAESLDDATGDARVILPLQALLALDDDTIAANAGRLGVELQPGDPLEKIEGRTDGLALVALAFPGFADGRSYSKAHLLRTRLGFTGVIRATGEVLTDQIAHMLRTGFDELVITDPVALKRLGAGQTDGLGLYYQPSTAPALAARAYSWRRAASPDMPDSPHIHHY